MFAPKLINPVYNDVKQFKFGDLSNYCNFIVYNNIIKKNVINNNIGGNIYYHLNIHKKIHCLRQCLLNYSILYILQFLLFQHLLCIYSIYE